MRKKTIESKAGKVKVEKGVCFCCSLLRESHVDINLWPASASWLKVK